MLDELRASGKEFVPAYILAVVYIGLADTDRAFAAMNQAMQQRPGVFVFLNKDAIWDPIRSDPRFADIVQRVGLPQ